MSFKPEISTLYSITDAGQVGEIRRHAMSMAEALDFNETQNGQLGIMVTEAAGNLVKHASGGEIILRTLQHDGQSGMELLAVDKGPGMFDVSRCMEDGHSTAGSPGTGLGALSRLSTCFDIYSQPGKGTVVLAQLWKHLLPPTHKQIGAICLPVSGEVECGDTWCVDMQPGGMRILMVDGLGHGPAAAQAAKAAGNVFFDHTQATPLEFVQLAHQALLATRGAALAVMQIDYAKQLMRFAGIGNISGSIVDMNNKSRGLVSYNGTVGHQLHKCQEMTYPWPLAGLLILHSDGLATRWKLDDYPGLSQRHPAVIAGVLYRDWQRGRDDVTVLVVKDQ